jgi:hypothetical protein
MESTTCWPGAKVKLFPDILKKNFHFTGVDIGQQNGINNVILAGGEGKIIS